MPSNEVKTHWRRSFCRSFRRFNQKSPTTCTKELIDVYNKYNASAVSVEEAPLEKMEQYGIINSSEVEKDVYKINELVEKPPMDKHHPILQ